MKPVIRTILRMSVYQILKMDRIPDSAVCDEAVKLAVKRKFHGLKGFVNGGASHHFREKKPLCSPTGPGNIPCRTGSSNSGNSNIRQRQ